MTDGPQGSSEEIIHLRAEPTPPLSLHPFLIKIRLLSKFGPLVIVLQAREAPTPHLGGRTRKTDFFFITPIFPKLLCSCCQSWRCFLTHSAVLVSHMGEIIPRKMETNRREQKPVVAI